MPVFAEPSAPTPHRPLIVADIGGTNARFAWVDEPGGDPLHAQTLPTADFAGPGAAMRHYLAGLPAALREQAERSGLQAAWALATSVEGDWVVMTNNRWQFSCRDEAQRLGLTDLRVFNDFEALACSLPRLKPSQLRAWDDRLPSLDGPLAVIGPGTGLGVAGMVPTRGRWQALPGEGGHMTLSAHDDFEAALIQRARARWPHVSGERLLSGIGLPLLHACVCEVSGLRSGASDAESVVALGVAGEPAARRTVDTFCAMLGGYAGNVALVLGARGGVFIGGGLVPRLGDLFFASEFRRRFEHKGRFSPYVAAIPTAVITDTMAALQGVSAAVADAHGV